MQSGLVIKQTKKIIIINNNKERKYITCKSDVSELN